MTPGTPSVSRAGKLFDLLQVVDELTPHGGAFNMAADEALLDILADNPLLRIYRWERPAVSFGYFDRAAPILLAYPGRDLVRRWTGGGMVEHGQDFTYALLVPRHHPLTARRADESYRLLHAVVAQAIAAAGFDEPALAPEPASCAGQVPRACFVHPVRHDLLLAGRKVAGAAQRRTRRGWLQQGSVQLGPGGAAELHERLRETLPAALATDVRRRELLPVERAAAVRLAGTKYGTDAWLRRF